VRTLSREDSILFHACHGAKHGWTRLQQVGDLAYLCAGETPAWDSILDRAARIGSRTMLFVGLNLGRALLGLEIPSSPIETALAEERVTALSRKIARRLFTVRAEGKFSEWGIALKSIDSTRGRLRYLARRAVSPKLSDSALMPLPRPLYPLYYVARPILLAIKHS
jgi:hypothetical protein